MYENALRQFGRLLQECDIEIEKIHAMLDDHLCVAPDDVNWAHAGTAGRLLKDLREITAYLVK